VQDITADEDYEIETKSLSDRNAIQAIKTEVARVLGIFISEFKSK
jgi:hypothetical protein